MKDKKILITGGAGFIGSSLSNLLFKSNEVIVFDNMSCGKKEFLKGSNLVKGDILSYDMKNLLKGKDIVFHLAANADVKISDPKIHFNQNVLTTLKILENIRESDVKNFVFTSTSAVYGEASVMQTPESYGPCLPISMYGAAKLACESLISAYSSNYGIKSTIFRFANCVGQNSTHGVTRDFVNKLKGNPRELEILGDGTQKKSYFYVSDCVDGMMFAIEHQKKMVDIFNIGSEDSIDVKKIADIVAAEMKLKNVKYKFTGGIDGIGWKGDVKTMLLSIDKMRKLGWKPKYNSEEAVRKTVQEMLKKV